MRFHITYEGHQDLDFEEEIENILCSEGYDIIIPWRIVDKTRTLTLEYGVDDSWADEEWDDDVEDEW